MTFPRVRFTVRRMLVATAAVAILLEIANLLWSPASENYASIAKSHRALEGLAKDSAASGEKWAASSRERAEDMRRRGTQPDEIAVYKALGLSYETHAAEYAEYAQRWRRKASHYGSLGLKYERAARYPWLSVAPDPPEPE